LKGFLSYDDEVLPGNYGFKDMVMALDWVKRNIRKFGGDPDQVHLMGQSSGGMAVHALSLSPMSKGIYKNTKIQIMLTNH
jgi:carboxylesterase type B